MKTINIKPLAGILPLLLITNLGYAQITLKKFDDPKMGGQIESIIFGGSASPSQANGTDSQAQTQRKEFNIQENNPYNKLSYDVENINATGVKVYKITKSQASELFQLSEDEIRIDSDIITASHYYIESNKKYAIIGYNIFGYDNNGEVTENTRRSTIRVINFDAEGIYRNDNHGWLSTKL